MHLQFGVFPRAPRLLVGLLSLLLCLAAGCGGGDKGTNPNGTADTLILGTDPASWTAVAVTTMEGADDPQYACDYQVRDSSDIGRALSNGVIGFRGVSIGCGQSCGPRGTYANLRSIPVDFTRYSTARLRCLIRAGGSGDPFPYHSGGLRGLRNDQAHLYVHVRSNVPGTPDLTYVVRRDYASVSDTTETPIDVSLENALGFHEATVEIDLDAKAACGEWYDSSPGGGYRYVPGAAILEVLDFRVTGRKE